MIRIQSLTLLPGQSEDLLKCKAAERLHVAEKHITQLRLRKKSVDARKKPQIFLHYTVDVSLDTDEAALIKKLHSPDVLPAPTEKYILPAAFKEEKPRPVVVGFGPGGIFAALVLAKCGLRPIVLERGADVDARTEAVNTFWKTGKLNPNSNVQFGEGGAGTFSDGKLNTGIHDIRIQWVLEQFVRAGADEDILYDAKPHIGTDRLKTVVKNLREEIIALGGEVRFGVKMEKIEEENGAVCAVWANGEKIPCSHLILAIGHSARDTFQMLLQSGVPMEPKPFSMGVRIEHLQEEIDLSQYGRQRDTLPPADYKLNVHLPDGGSAYTFCMCPGGSVVAAASEEGGVVTNGMSNRARDGKNANAALLVTLTPEDFPDKSTLGGMYWQRQIEQTAFAAGGGNYRAPMQTVGAFLTGKPCAPTVEPSYAPGVTEYDLHKVLPRKITDTLEKALPALGKRLKGFDNPGAVMTAPETRSSSPVRILRGEDRQSRLRGLYPCGEGAGYAGGITSAAVDGIKCAEAVVESLR